MSRSGTYKLKGIVVAVTLALTATGIHAQDIDQAALLRLVQEQAAKIEQLESRLNTLEHQGVDAKLSNAPSTQSAHTAIESRVVALEDAQKNAPKVDWNRVSPTFSSADGENTFRVRGRLLADFSSTGGSDYSNRNLSGTEIRSIRLGVEGKYGRYRYELEGEFADNKAAWRGAYVAVGHKLFGQDAELLIGNMLNDRGLEGSSGITSSPFHDTNMVAAAISPQRGLYGVGLLEKVYGDSWHASLAVNGNDFNNTGNNNDLLAYAARAHWNPVKTASTTLHLGGWGFYETISDDYSGVLSTPYMGGHFNDNVRVVSGAISSPVRDKGYGAEVAGLWGPIWATGEWGRRHVTESSTVGGDSYHHDAYSLSAGWFIHGGMPGYNSKTGVWSRAKVSESAFDGGIGAWELKGRYENVDFTDVPGGGKGSAYTLGVNWYWNSTMRVMLDTVYWKTNNPTGVYIGKDTGYTVNARFQLFF